MTTSRQTPRLLPIAALHPHDSNVRDDLGDITELAASIRQHGLVQPVVVTEHPTLESQYVILAGHRRVAAAATIGLEQVVCIVRHDAGNADDHVALMLVENMQRRNLNPVERARAMKRLVQSGMTQSDVARRLGVTPTTVANTILLLELSEEELDQVVAGELRVGDARAAVKAARATYRVDHGASDRGRPPVTEPRHFIRAHPLASAVSALCDHTTRPHVDRSVLACGQCWEQVIRDDERGVP